MTKFKFLAIFLSFGGVLTVGNAYKLVYFSYPFYCNFPRMFVVVEPKVSTRKMMSFEDVKKRKKA